MRQRNFSCNISNAEVLIHVFSKYLTCLLENYLFLIKNLNCNVAKSRPIDLADIRRLCMNGFEASLLPPAKKIAYMKEVNDYFLTVPGDLYKQFMQ